MVDIKYRKVQTDNSTYKKLAVQWLMEALCFVSNSVGSRQFSSAKSPTRKFKRKYYCEKLTIKISYCGLGSKYNLKFQTILPWVQDYQGKIIYH
jgi:hypothetical protein